MLRGEGKVFRKLIFEQLKAYEWHGTIEWSRFGS